jgi:hypothetical protein
MFQTKVVQKIKTHILYSVTYFRKSCRYEIMWHSQTGHRWQYNAGYIRLKKHTQNKWHLLILYCNNICTNAPQCNVYTYIVCIVASYHVALNWNHQHEQVPRCQHSMHYRSGIAKGSIAPMAADGVRNLTLLYSTEYYDHPSHTKRQVFYRVFIRLMSQRKKIVTKFARWRLGDGTLQTWWLCRCLSDSGRKCLECCSTVCSVQDMTCALLVVATQSWRGWWGRHRPDKRDLVTDGPTVRFAIPSNLTHSRRAT